MNPYNAEGTDNAKLYHLTSGRAASNDMKDDQINVVSIRVLHGQTNFGKSEKKIQPGKKRFAKPIKRRKIKNFTTDAKKINIHRKDLTVKEVLCTRDISGCLVYLAAVQNLELEHVMSYPMTMAPLSLAHIDGAINRTDKSSLMRKLVKSHKSGNLDMQNINVCLIDFIYFLRMLPPQLPATFW